MAFGAALGVALTAGCARDFDGLFVNGESSGASGTSGSSGKSGVCESGSGDCEVTCAKGTSCAIDCVTKGKCIITCDPGAACLCNGIGCSLSCATEKTISCPKDTIVCQRDCP